MGEKIMYTCMCNWVPMLYSGKKSLLGDIKIKNQLKNFQNKIAPPKIKYLGIYLTKEVKDSYAMNNKTLILEKRLVVA